MPVHKAMTIAEAKDAHWRYLMTKANMLSAISLMTNGTSDLYLS